MSDPCDLTATEARRLIGLAQLGAVELLESCIQRIKSVNPAVNAVVALDPERAHDAAKAADESLANRAPLGPLHGLPIGIKDLNETRGLRTTFGSPLYAEHVPEADEGLVARLRNAGGIIAAKTNTPEFGAGSNTDNAVYGKTRNPFDLDRTSGGSSGGAAAALATGMLPLCHGSDSGGSLRAPAVWCGVTAIRPTPGLVPSERRTLPLTAFSVQGPMARTVSDLALFLQPLAEFDARDPLAYPRAPIRLPQSVDLSRLRVRYSVDLGVAPVDNGIRQVFADRIEAIGHLFAECEPANPDMHDAREVFWGLRGLQFVASHATRWQNHREQLGANVRSNTEAGLAMSVETIANAERGWNQLFQRFATFMEPIDLLLCPGNAIPPFPVETGIPREINGVALENYMDTSLVRSALTLTMHPVVALPCGTDHTGTPFGFQMLGHRFADQALLDIAHSLELALAGESALSRPVPDLKSLL
ncbi:MAG: amidase family protein [Pseudomonadota bacterium]